MAYQMNVRSLHILTALIFVNCFIIRLNVVKAFVFDSHNIHSLSSKQQRSSAFQSAALPSLPSSFLIIPTSPLASKIVFQSPAMENIYREILVSSKKLNIRKHYSSGAKIKKPKKDSKIFYIPIPAMPYRFIPGYGYDYQPVRISAIPHKFSRLAANNNMQGSKQRQQQQTHQDLLSQMKPVNYMTSHGAIKRKQTVDVMKVATSNSTSNTGESEVISLHHTGYYLNGRPIRLQAANAQPHNLLISKNLNSKLYFNKKIIH